MVHHGGMSSKRLQRKFQCGVREVRSEENAETLGRSTIRWIGATTPDCIRPRQAVVEVLVTVNIELHIEDETLDEAQIVKITGRHFKAQQIAWLQENGWQFVVNARDEPVVGRMYARFKLAGVELSQATVVVARPDFSKAR